MTQDNEYQRIKGDRKLKVHALSELVLISIGNSTAFLSEKEANQTIMLLKDALAASKDPHHLPDAEAMRLYLELCKLDEEVEAENDEP